MRFLTASSLVLGLAIGCSSEVDTVDGTGGSGGSTTVGSTTTVTTGSVSTSVGTTTASTTSSVSSSSSTGGGNNCEQGCAHILECTGFDACAMGVDCQNPMFDCPMGCINDASCADIIASTGGTPPPALQACLSACQGGQGGGGQGGGAPGDCQSCVFQNDCVNPCLNDQDCIQGWGQCAQACTDPACFAACDAMFPQTAPIFDQVYDCACMGCSSECEMTMDPCNGGSGGGP